jgi:6,7-dimethyl-8-ribityllumazine synthase
VSSRDIDTTSENVLHDWARDAGDEQRDEPGEQEELVVESGDAAEDDAPAWGTAASSEESVEDPAAVAEPEPETEVATTETPEVTEDEVAEGDGEVELDETPMHLELSHEHAAGDLHIPDGYAVLEGVSEGGRRAVGVVVSRFNGQVTSQLLDGALAELDAAGVRQEAITIMVVPGAFELPLAATALAKTRRFACIVALGCVIRGDTPHFDYVSSEAASGLQLAALETGVPVSFGVLTLDRIEQAEARVGKGAEAVRSALEMADLFAHLRAAAAR